MNDKCVIEHKKEIGKRLGRPLIQTNPYEVCVCVKVSIFVEKVGFFLHFLIWAFFWVLEDYVNLGSRGN